MISSPASITVCSLCVSPLKTIFEINSNSKSSASLVMRAKRARDTRLVDKFTKKREDLVAESRLHLPPAVLPSTRVTETGDSEEDEDLQVRPCPPSHTQQARLEPVSSAVRG